MARARRSSCRNRRMPVAALAHSKALVRRQVAGLRTQEPLKQTNRVLKDRAMVIVPTHPAQVVLARYSTQ